MAKKSPLAIQSGVTKRAIKELSMYRMEFVVQEAKIEALRAVVPCDDHMVRKQIEVLDETRDMIPDTLTRLQKSVLALDTLLAESDDLQSEECVEASAVAAEANAVLEKETV